MSIKVTSTQKVIADSFEEKAGHVKFYNNGNVSAAELDEWHEKVWVQSPDTLTAAEFVEF